MSRILVLDQTIAELIAAGEVVERPASIVKELLENAIDAGATKVTVEIKGGGIGYIRISDNGSGIHKDDIQHAFLRHATSKVSSAKDLESIETLGFRGEALSSIAAVSKVELTTKTEDDIDAWFYEIQGGSALEVPFPTGAPNGTTLVIRDIFYNTPARMKFLRRDVAEGNAVAQVVDKTALSHPEIAFEFIRDTSIRLTTSGNGDLKAVIAAIYGRDFTKELLLVNYKFQNKIIVSGYVGHPNYSKPTRTYQNFFINGRYVRTRTAGVAVEEAFKGKLMTGRFPVAVLSIEVDANQVDANVHPAKIEVRFSQEKDIYNAVYFGVRNALEKTEVPISSVSNRKTAEKINPLTAYVRTEEVHQEKLHTSQSLPVYSVEKTSNTESSSFTNPLHLSSSSRGSVIKENIQNSSDFTEFITSVPYAVKQVEESKSENHPTEEREALSLKFIGELFNTYILLESDFEDLVLIDKHAAHERIHYEKIKKNAVAGVRQVLLSAEAVTLQKNEYTAILDNLETLKSLGFLVEDFGTGTVLVRETPGVLDGKDIGFLLSEIAEKLLSSKRNLTPNLLDSLYYSIACKAAVRGGDKTSQLELMEIVKRLEENPQITHCPHGRPVSIRLSRHDIEKMFGRLG